MNIFLKMKAWQIFAFQFITMVIYFLLFFTIDKNLDYFSTRNILFYLNITSSVIFNVLWMWAVGNRLNEKLDIEIRPKPGIFILGLMYLFIFYLVLGAVLILVFFHQKLILFLYFIPFGILAAYFDFKCSKFIGENLSLVELGTKEKTSKYNWSGPYLLIGIWKIQPKINAIFKEN